MKDFTKAFDKLLNMIKNKENFAFTRFSDGELAIMQNRHVVLADNYFIDGSYKGQGRYTIEEQKEFDPSKHQFCREALLESYSHTQPHYYKGICTGSDPHVGSNNFKWMVDLHGGDHENLTFANLLINANYRRFIEELIPQIAERQIVYIVNENANINNLPFDLYKTFTIGSNCMINDYGVSDEVAEYLLDKQDLVVLCSAASLSNFVIYKSFKSNPNNTFLDIGSCLNPLLDLEGWRYTRGYLTSYWLGSNSPFGRQVDYWG